MTLNRWKVLACTLAVGVGGLAVFATPPTVKSDPAKEPAPLPDLTVKPSSPTNGSDTAAPAKEATSGDIDLVLPDPVVTPAAKTEESPKAQTFAATFEPIAPPVTPVVPASADTKDVPKSEETKAPDSVKSPTIVLPPVIKPEAADTSLPKVELPKAPVIDVAPPLKPESTKPLATGPAPLTNEKPEPAVTIPTPTSPNTAPDLIREPHRLPLAPAAKAGSQPAKLKMLLRMGDGQPRFEIRNSVSTELLLKVYGEKIELQAPPESKSSLAGVTAMGRVRFVAPGIEGTCDHLTILSGTGEVLLKGNIQLKSKRGKAWSEMTAEKMVYQIGTAGLSSPAARNPVTPASYIPD